MDHILQKEVVYKTQMVDVHEAVLRVVEPKGWAKQSRGRRAHVSVHGPVNGLDGVIDIEMEETDWQASNAEQAAERVRHQLGRDRR